MKYDLYKGAKGVRRLYYYLYEWSGYFALKLWLTANIEGLKRLLHNDPTYKKFGIWKKN